MDKGTKKVLVIGGLGLGAYLLYNYLSGPSSSPSASSAPGGGLTAVPQSSMTLAVLDPAVQAWILQHSTAWITQFNTVAYPHMSQADANNLLTIYGYWLQQQVPPAGLNAWWTNFQAQYGLNGL